MCGIELVICQPRIPEILEDVFQNGYVALQVEIVIVLHRPASKFLEDVLGVCVVLIADVRAVESAEKFLLGWKLRLLQLGGPIHIIVGIYSLPKHQFGAVAEALMRRLEFVLAKIPCQGFERAEQESHGVDESHLQIAHLL